MIRQFGPDRPRRVYLGFLDSSQGHADSGGLNYTYKELRERDETRLTR